MPSVGLVCGPTGGHLLPATLVGRSLRKQSAEVTLYSTNRDALDWLTGFDLPFVELTVEPWSGQSLAGKVRSLVSILRQYYALRDPISDHDVLVSFGGYPAVPGLLAAWEAGVRVFFQEQNRIPGRTHRLFSRLAEQTFYGFPPLEQYNNQTIEVTGNPVRPAGRREDPWFDRDPLLVVFGGSQGSEDLSDYLASCGAELVDRGWSVYYLRGKFGRDLSEEPWVRTGTVRQQRFDPDLDEVLPRAECIWSRAGAGTLSELIEYNVPGLVFPYPYATDNHQLENARWVHERGPVTVIEDGDDIPPERLLEATESICSSKKKYTVPWNRDVLPQDRIARRILS